VKTISLIGVGGFGHVHVDNIFRLARLGRVELSALISPEGIDPLLHTVTPEVLAWARTVPFYPTFDEYLSDAEPATIVVVCSPIDTHAALASQALQAGCHVLLEKPPTTGLNEFEALAATAEAAGRIVQVGFQSFGSAALPRLAKLISSGALGRIEDVGGVGVWSRPQTYWTRSYWAGKRSIDGRSVVDGVVTNALAHAVATALKLAGATMAADIDAVTLDQYHVNAIECDDTSAVRIITTGGLPVTLGLTLAAPADAEPLVFVRGARGSATLYYTTDTIALDVGGEHSVAGIERFGRTDLTENLLDHLADPTVPLLCPLADTGAFMRVLDTVQAAQNPRAIPPDFVHHINRDGMKWLTIDQVGQWCERVADAQATFAELGAPWAGSH